MNDRLHFRPIDVDVWYPATAVRSDSTLRFGDFLQSLQDRANFYSAPGKFDSLKINVAKSFCEGFLCSQVDLLLQHLTKTRKEPAQVDEQFPLILYFASFGSMGYENYLLFESLAQQGYIVACVNSIGRYPGDMTTKNADLMEQVKDADQILNRLKKDPHTDTTKIGILGYSWGGLAGVILAMNRQDFKTIVSLDGSEFHHFDYNKSEDQDFNETLNAPLFKNAVLSVDYLRLESNPQPALINKDSVYNFLIKVSNTKQVVKIDSASHQDFSSLPTAVRSSGKCPVPKTYTSISSLTIAHFNKHLKTGFVAK